jgi:hypothetical protein
MHFQGIFAKNCFCFTSLTATDERNHVKSFILLKVKWMVTRDHTGYQVNNYHLIHFPMGPQYYKKKPVPNHNIHQLCYITKVSDQVS